MIKNKATINENVNATMKVLQDEIKRLKDELELSKKVQNETNSFLKRTNTESYPNKSLLTKASDNDKSLSDIKRENMILDKTKEMKSLISKIDNLFAISPQLEAKLKILDDIYMEEFYENKSKYSKNFENTLSGLQEKLKLFSSTVNTNEEVLQEFKEAFGSQEDCNNFEKMQKFLDELKLFKYDFELNSYLDVYKLEEENRNLKNEIETYKSISLILQQNKLYSKITCNDLNFYNSSIKEFIDLNKELKDFFRQNLISKNGVKTLKEINLALIDQISLDKMKFQLEEYRLNENNKSKLIEELESENFLLSMEIMKLKSGEDNIIFSENDHIKNSESIDFGNSSLSNIDLISENKDEKKIVVRKSLRNSISNNNLLSNSRSSLSHNESFKNLNKKFDNLNKNKEKEKDNNFLENLKSSVKFNNINKENKDISSGNDRIIKENYELLKIKEKLDDALVNLEEKENEMILFNKKIEELEIINENLEKNISINNITIQSLKDEIDTLYDTNNFLSMDIQKLNEKQEKFNEIINDDFPDLVKNFEKNSLLINNITDDYKNEINSFKAIYSGFMGRSSELIKKFSTSLNNSTKKLEKSENVIAKIKENMFDCCETITISIKQFENCINKKLEAMNNKILELNKYVEDSKKQFEQKLKKQENIFQTRIYKKLNNTLNKVGISSTKEDFDELLEKLEVYLNNKLFNYLSIDKNKLSKLEKKVLDLKEEKKTINNDLILLRTDFSDALSNLALNNKIALLMKFKEENFKLRNEINQMRKKNDNLEKQFIKIQEVNQTNTNLINNNLIKRNTFTADGNIQNNLNNSNTSLIPNQNFTSNEDYIKLKKDYHEILEKVFDLEENETNKNLLSKINTKEKLAFRKALEILNKITEAKDHDKFFNKISYKNDFESTGENYESFKTMQNLTPENRLKKSTTDLKKNSFLLERDQLKTIGNKEPRFSKISIGKVELSKNKTPNKINMDYKSNYSNYSSVNNILMKSKISGNSGKSKMSLVEKVEKVKPNKSFIMPDRKTSVLKPAVNFSLYEKKTKVPAKSPLKSTFSNNLK